MSNRSTKKLSKCGQRIAPRNERRRADYHIQQALLKLGARRVSSGQSTSIIETIEPLARQDTETMSNNEHTQELNSAMDMDSIDSTDFGYSDAEMTYQKPGLIRITQDDGSHVTTNDASIQTSNAVVDNLIAFKATVNEPLHFDITESTDTHLDKKQKASVKLESLMSAHKVTRDAF